MKLSYTGREALKQLEGFRAKAYTPLPGDVATIGFGFTKGVKMGDVMSPEEADARLTEELVEYEVGVLSALGNATQSQFDACVLLAWNIGVPRFKTSTVVKCHKAGNFEAAASAFKLWNKFKGKPIAGLTRRRNLEAAMYLKDAEVMPQTVDAPNTMVQSSMNKASVIGGGTAAVAAATEVTNSIVGFKSGISALGEWLVPALLIITVCACGWLIYERVKLRKEGRL